MGNEEPYLIRISGLWAWESASWKPLPRMTSQESAHTSQNCSFCTCYSFCRSPPGLCLGQGHAQPVGRQAKSVARSVLSLGAAFTSDLVGDNLGCLLHDPTKVPSRTEPQLSTWNTLITPLSIGFFLSPALPPSLPMLPRITP